MGKLSKHAVETIGKKLVECQLSCDGIVNDRESGILPRCLFFEKGVRGERDCVIVGLNPGQSSSEEQAYYRNDDSYESTFDYWNKKVRPRPSGYYGRLKLFVKLLGFSGSILWTELIKCESDKKSIIPVQTYRTCVSNYLAEEIKDLDTDTPIFAIGRAAYAATAYLFRDRAVIGVAHPTGSWGRRFSGLFQDSKERLDPKVSRMIHAALNTRPATTIWVSAK